MAATSFENLKMEAERVLARVVPVEIFAQSDGTPPPSGAEIGDAAFNARAGRFSGIHEQAHNERRKQVESPQSAHLRR
jgi:hypothetical protein